MLEITTIDAANRKVTIINSASTLIEKEGIVLNEFDSIGFKFLPKTEDTFETELVLLEVENEDGETETKPYMRRKDNGIILSFDPNDYHIGEEE
ncbi:MAG: hypothetical protein ACRC0G_09405 [Fusobacteriaceae bacterium]